MKAAGGVLTRNEDGLPELSEIAVGSRVVAIRDHRDEEGDAAGWIDFEFENGWRICVLPDCPLVFIHPEQQ
jgi:hypothetical protein